MLLFPLLIQIMSSTFVRKGISNFELFYGFKIPKFFGKLVLSLSYLQRTDLSTYSYVINDISNLSDLRCFINDLLEDNNYFKDLEKELDNNKYLLETYHLFVDKEGNVKFKDIIHAFKSILINLRDANNVNDLVSTIFTISEKMGRDFCQDNNSFDSCEYFFKLYLASEDNLLL